MDSPQPSTSKSIRVKYIQSNIPKDQKGRKQRIEELFRHEKAYFTILEQMDGNEEKFQAKIRKMESQLIEKDREIMELKSNPPLDDFVNFVNFDEVAWEEVAQEDVVNHREVGGAVVDHPNTQGVVVSHHEVRGAVVDHPNTQGVVVSHHEVHGAVVDHPNAQEVIVNHREVHGVVVDHPNAQEVIVNHREVGGAVVDHPNTGKIPCHMCGAHFSSKYNVANHIQSVHDGKKYMCTQCDKGFAYSTSLKKHKKRLHDKLKYPCPSCDAQLGCADSLKKHTASVHQKIKNFLCGGCQKTFFTKQQFQNHYKKYHNSN
jgi:hypothetical protein